MISEEEYKELRELVTKCCGAEVSILEGFKSLMTLNKEEQQSAHRAWEAVYEARSATAQAKVYQDFVMSLPSGKAFADSLKRLEIEAQKEIYRRMMAESGKGQ